MSFKDNVRLLTKFIKAQPIGWAFFMSFAWNCNIDYFCTSVTKVYTMKNSLLTLMLLIGCLNLNAKDEDIREVKGKELIIESNYIRPAVLRLDSLNGLFLVSGKKNEVIDLTLTNSNVAEKNARQLFAKVPGIFVYDMDGSGNQINISTRGLDAHRGWEFNIRKDGIITNSDLYGYPASHFSPPMESIEKIELIRGTASLQFGSQFGGMLNYVGKKIDTNKVFNFESINSIGSFGMLSTYNSIGGKTGNLLYSAYISKRSSDGYRDNSKSDYDAQQINLTYLFSNNVKIKAEWSHTTYLYQLPGQLNDSMFKADPTQATRSRNFYSPDIHIPSITFDWKIDEKTKLKFTSSLLLGLRNSVLFDKPTNIADTINKSTYQYNNRQVDIDEFKSFTNELRLLHNYHLFNSNGFFTFGLQYLNNTMLRKQLGIGTTGNDYDLSITSNGFVRDMSFSSNNIGIFFENSFKIMQELSFNLGVRFETGKSQMDGVIDYFPDGEVPNTILHNIPLFSASMDYKISDYNHLYTAFSQAYRPVIFKDIIPGTTYDRVSKDLKDAFGYNFEIGYRGEYDILRWDLSYFALQYNNRLGNLTLTDSSGNLGIYKTNIGNSFTQGVETYIEADFKIYDKLKMSIFTSTSYMNAVYENAKVKSGNSDEDVSGNKVESVPNIISRNGITLYYNEFQLSILYSYVSESFADALNTRIPTPTGAVGLVPEYGLLDLNALYKYSENLTFRFNVSNALDKSYFTKRPLFYPGPGIWPSDRRSFNLTLQFKL